MDKIDGVVKSVAFYYGEFDNLFSFTLESLDGMPIDAVFNWELPNSSFRYFVTRAAHVKEGTMVCVELPAGISVKKLPCNSLTNAVDIKNFAVIGPKVAPSAGNSAVEKSADS